jgi:uncharacterized protein YndB with AHSA1/START domain
MTDTTETATVRVERHIDATPETVFDAWLDPDAVGRWLFATPGGVMERVEIDARVGGRFRIDERRAGELASHFGGYEEIDRPRRLVFSFGIDRAPDAMTRVTVEITPEADGSRLALTHERVWADYATRTGEGWATVLDGLARALAG